MVGSHVEAVAACALVVVVEIGIAQRGALCGLDEDEAHGIVHFAFDAFAALAAKVGDVQVVPVDAVASPALLMLVF